MLFYKLPFWLETTTLLHGLHISLHPPVKGCRVFQQQLPHTVVHPPSSLDSGEVSGLLAIFLVLSHTNCSAASNSLHSLRPEACDHAQLAPWGQYQPDSKERRPGCRRCTWCPAGASCHPTATYTWCRWSCEPPPGSPRTRRTGAWASLCTEDIMLRGAVRGDTENGLPTNYTKTRYHADKIQSKIGHVYHISPNCPFRIMMNTNNYQWDICTWSSILVNIASIHFSKKNWQVYNMGIQTQRIKPQMQKTTQWSEDFLLRSLCMAWGLNQQL